jgi:hypothetical protein
MDHIDALPVQGILSRCKNNIKYINFIGLSINF